MPTKPPTTGKTASDDPAGTLDQIAGAVGKGRLPSVSAIAGAGRDPFKTLISTVISLRTKDEVTTAATERLFRLARTPGEMSLLEPDEISRAIYPAGFYSTKAVNIRRIADILSRDCEGRVPAKLDELLELPGVGRKTANLVLGVGHGIPAVCVDTHVHRIANRLGWVETGSPEETERALAELFPESRWIQLNEVLVSFGQQICTPTSPRCSGCPLTSTCPRIGVTRSR